MTSILSRQQLMEENYNLYQEIVRLREERINVEEVNKLFDIIDYLKKSLEWVVFIDTKEIPVEGSESSFELKNGECGTFATEILNNLIDLIDDGEELLVKPAKDFSEETSNEKLSNL